MTEKRELTVEELLSEQKNPTFLATIQSIAGKPHDVKVTPWIRGRGCACHFALVISKNSIDKVIVTQDTHPCCGQTLRVVEVLFKEDSMLPLHQVFADMSRRAALQRSARIKSPFGFRSAGKRARPSRSRLILPIEQPKDFGDGFGRGLDGGGGGGDDDGDGGTSGGLALDETTCEAVYQECLAFADGSPDPEVRFGLKLGCLAVYYGCLELPA